MLRRKFNRSLFINLLALVILTTLSLFIYQNRQTILDQLVIWQYPASSEAMALVDRSGMSSDGKFVFEASRPTIESTQVFNSVCSAIENTMSILGCYTDSKIYIYNVSDSELDGIKEVTATHEALHAVYARLPDNTKKRLAELLEVEYKKLENNSAYQDRMAFYARTEPGERTNELHSVIGTEISDISLELENYYKQYFSDRQKVVKLYDKYSSVFDKLNDRANYLAEQLKTLSDSINKNAAQYNTSVETLNTDIDRFNQKANTEGGFNTQAEFEAARLELVNRVSVLDNNRISINADIDKYNKILAEYNSNEVHSKRLYNSIDSTPAPAPSV